MLVILCVFSNHSFHANVSAHGSDFPTIAFRLLAEGIHAGTLRNRRVYATADEEVYLAKYASAKVVTTQKKFGWDCLRHLEILVSGVSVYFLFSIFLFSQIKKIFNFYFRLNILYSIFFKVYIFVMYVIFITFYVFIVLVTPFFSTLLGLSQISTFTFAAFCCALRWQTPQIQAKPPQI